MTPGKRNYQRVKQRAFLVVADGRPLRCNVRCCPIGGGIDVLTMDHIHNDGAQHGRDQGNPNRRNGFSGYTLYKWVIQNPEEARRRLQLLCAIHNTPSWKDILRPEDYRTNFISPSESEKGASQPHEQRPEMTLPENTDEIIDTCEPKSSTSKNSSTPTLTPRLDEGKSSQPYTQDGAVQNV